MGGVFGTVVTLPTTGYIVEKFGWRFGFYAPAVVALLMSFLWLYFVSDSPASHPRITKPEKDLIEKSLGSNVSTGGKKSSWPPMGQMLLSPSFYALLVLHFGSTWGLFFLVTAAPKFMSEALKFNLTEAGILSSLPYLFRLFFAFVFGSIGDRIRNKDSLSVTTIRKMFCVFCKWDSHKTYSYQINSIIFLAHILPGLFLILMCFVGYDPYVCVAIITASVIKIGFKLN